MLEWLIIGGGIHGVHLANRLVCGAEVERDRVAIVDPHGELLARWDHCTAMTGMGYLRSPVVHHIGLEPMELLEFSRGSRWRGSDCFRPPYDRPSLPLFRAHCEAVLDQSGLRRLHRQGMVEGIGTTADGYKVETDQGVLTARRVVIAVGSGDRLAWPEWVCPREARSDGRVWHIFDEGFQREKVGEAEEVVVVGLGISAAQLSLALTDEGKRVTVVGRHEIRVHDFDSEPCWLGPKCQRGFRRLACPKERRAVIDEARHRGSMPKDVARAFQAALDEGEIVLRQGEIFGWESDEQEVRLLLEGGASVGGGALVLATGFRSPRPDQGWLAPAMNEMGLSASPCGFPMVGADLQWRTGLFVSGPLAELTLGPAARNISGARMAARAIARAA